MHCCRIVNGIKNKNIKNSLGATLPPVFIHWTVSAEVLPLCQQAFYVYRPTQRGGEHSLMNVRLFPLLSSSYNRVLLVRCDIEMTLNVNDAFLCLYDKRAPQAPILYLTKIKTIFDNHEWIERIIKWNISTVCCYVHQVMLFHIFRVIFCWIFT